MKGLVIKNPWISLILEGLKTWEMRSQNTSVRGRIALIEAGTGTVRGIAELKRTRGPLSDSQMLKYCDMHQIPPEDLSKAEFSKWRMAWILDEVKELKAPIPYQHPNGAVTWVNLSDHVVTEINRSLSCDLDTDVLVPVARDGSWFGPHLARSGKCYTIGAKGEEFQAEGFTKALADLGEMGIARWRRPNSNGNWGIVAAAGEWKNLRELIGS